MRDIKFRGLHKGGVWQYGNYVFNRPSNLHYIVSDHEDWVAIDPETVGQYTGLKDKNGKEIYEGDIVELIPTEECKIHKHMFGIKEVIWSDDDARFYYHNFISMNWSGWESVEIIGNIHENPELL